MGAATAHILAKEGAKLVLCSRNAEALGSRAESIRKINNTEVSIVVTDLTVRSAADDLVKSTIAQFERIDILINAAGASRGGLFWELSDDVWEESFRLKVMGTIRTMRAAIPFMIKQNYGRIVNIVGNTGLQPGPRLLPGSSANAALLAITRGLAEDLAPHNVVVNALNPGPTRTERWTILMKDLAASSGRSIVDVERDFTDQIPLDRLAEPDEIAGMVAFLASDRAANLTGAALTPDGGWTRGIG